MGDPVGPRGGRSCGAAEGGRRLGICLNWRILAPLAAAAVLLFVLAPRVAGAGLPLLAAACPLSMALMMWGMRREGSGGTPGPDSRAAKEMSGAEPTRAVRLEELRDQLRAVWLERERLAEEIEALERQGEPEAAEGGSVSR